MKIHFPLHHLNHLHHYFWCKRKNCSTLPNIYPCKQSLRNGSKALFYAIYS